jgi:hypothetical protein
VSNTRVIINGTTYATANVTSVRTVTTPAKNGCAAVMIALGALGAFGGLVGMIASKGDDSVSTFVVCVILLVVGYLWYASLKPTYHVMLASASGERQGLTSQDPALVSRTTAAIADAIVYRG